MTSIDLLLQTLIDAHQPLSVSQLAESHSNVARRTLQRWLNQLLENQQITAIGQGRARRYCAKPTIPTSPSSEHYTFPSYIPISSDSKEVLNYIDKPISGRHPVGYQREFIDGYQPNVTFYLSEPIRKQLRRMGDTKHNELPAGTYGKAILNRLLIDLSWASSHLEGNTYTRLDTHDLIEHGKAAHGKATIETQMILNHKSAIEMLVDNAQTTGFNRYTILNLHSTLSENLLPNPSDEGRIRQHPVEIGKSVFHPLWGDAQIGVILDEVLAKAELINDPFEQSFFIMVHLPYLQPFSDVNKRTSRLAANLPLIRANLCPLVFLDVPEQAYSRATLGVYEMTRVELLRDLYLWAYERSTREYLAVKQNLAEPDPFRLQYRSVIKQTIFDVITNPIEDTLNMISQSLNKQDIVKDKENVRALVIEELRRIHEGVLFRYGLRPSEYYIWKEKQ